MISTNRLILIGLIGGLIGASYAVRVMAPVGMDPSILLALGEESSLQTSYASDLLGEVAVRPSLGHDGKFFFAQANDPWFLDPENHAAVLDRPAYRGQRMLYPMVAGGFGLFSPTVTVWAMVAWNVAAMGAGAALLAALVRGWGATPWLGLAFPVNLGLLSELSIGGAGIIALALGVAAVLAFERDRLLAAATCLALAALSREVMLAFAAGLAISAWIATRRVRWQLMLAPVLAVVVWGLYLRSRVGSLASDPQVRELTLPFVGLGEAAGYWLHDGTDLAIGIIFVVTLILFAIRAVRGTNPLAWGALPFVALASMLSVFVWREHFDIARAIAPVLTAYPVLLFLSRRKAPDLAASS